MLAPVLMLPRSAKSLSRGELRVVVFALALSLWAMTVMVWARAPIPCGDFVCPYTMGSLVHHPERIYNADAFHAAQIALVPASGSLFYPPVYPPQLAVMSQDLVALDATCARIIGLDPDKIDYLVQAADFLGVSDASRITHRGELPSRYSTRFDLVPALQHLRST